MSTMNIFQISLEIWGCVISMIIAMLSGKVVFRAKGGIQSIWITLVLNCLLLASDALCYVYRGDISTIGIVMTRIGNFAVFFIEGIMVWLFIYAILQLTTDKQHISIKNPFLAISTICISLQLLGCFITPFTGFYYSFNEMNRYVRGDGIILSFAFLGVVLIISSIQIIKNRQSLSSSVWKAFVSATIVVAVFMLVQFVSYGISLINIALTIGIVIIFINLWLDDINKEFQGHINGMETIINELRTETSKEENL